MDKQQKIGFVLIFLIIVGFSFFNAPSKEEQEKRLKWQDSVANVAKQKEILKAQELADLERAKALAVSNPDSAVAMFGDFGAAMGGKEETIVLENNLIKMEVNSKGAAPSLVQLKEFTTYGKEPLVMFKGDDNKFNVVFKGRSNFVNTKELYFKTKEKTDSSVTLTVEVGGGSLDFNYVLHNNSYLVDFNITTNNLQNVLLPENAMLEWSSKVPVKERSATFESRYCELTYKLYGSSDIDELSAAGQDEEEVEDPVHWIAFKDQYFSSVLIADGGKPLKKVKLNSSNVSEQKKGYVQDYNAYAQLGFNPAQTQVNNFRYYFGPNKYNMLCSLDDNNKGDDVLKLNRLVYLGWSMARWVNQALVNPIFNLLASFISNYGLVIFLLTLIIKLILLPLTYKSYLSTAKMRVLKPEVEAAVKDIPESESMLRMQKTQEVYRNAGVSQMGGCLPMLLSFPILVAAFYYFPTCFDLRGVSFLWADDLSAYDPFIEFGFHIPFIGDHISLFCLLMSAANILYTKYNMQMTDTGAQQQMPMMKWMMYLMPIMFFFWFNDSASGLTYYYLVSLLLTVGQTVLIRKMVNEDEVLEKLHAKAAERKAKGVDSRGYFQRLQERAIEQAKEVKK